MKALSFALCAAILVATPSIADARGGHGGGGHGGWNGGHGGWHGGHGGWNGGTTVLYSVNVGSGPVFIRIGG